MQNFLMILTFLTRSADSKPILDQPISMKELYDTLISMKQNNTPGYDGFPVAFYVAFWPDISDF